MTGVTNKNRSSVEEEILEIARRLLDYNILSSSRHGNISIIADEGRKSFVMTGSALGDPSGISLSRLSITGDILEGNMRAVEEDVVGMHAIVYTVRPDVTCVIHTHSPAATAFAVANKSLPCVSEGLARWGFRREVPVVPYAPRGSRGAIAGISEMLNEFRAIPGVLLASHGVLVFGSSSEEAIRRSVALEEGADLALRAEVIGGAVGLSEEEAAIAMSARTSKSN